MSMPKFPTDAGSLTRENVINQIISSIAMEELGLAHVINAEGEKLQYILGTLEGVSPPETPPTVDEILKANNSVQKTLDTIMSQQMFLRSKMTDALNAPTGAPAPTVTIGENGNWFVNGTDTGISAIGDISIDPSGYWVINGTVTDVLAQGPEGPQGEAGLSPTVSIGPNGNWFIDDIDTGETATPTLGSTLSISATDTWEIDSVDTGIPVTGTLTIVGGNWYVDGIDTGVPAQGPTGAVGFVNIG